MEKSHAILMYIVLAQKGNYWFNTELTSKTTLEVYVTEFSLFSHHGFLR